jgi:hypothetical protein
MPPPPDVDYLNELDSPFTFSIAPDKVIFGSNLKLPRGLAVNRTIDGSTYPGEKLVPSSPCKNIVSCMKHINLYWGLFMPSSG